MANVRHWDPFSPAKRRGRKGVKPAQEPEPASAEPEKPADSGVDLERLKHAELVELAKQRGLPYYGTKADLIKRLRGEA